VRDSFFQKSDRVAQSYPCSEISGCVHEVVRHDENRIVAVCKGAPWNNCDDIDLTPADLVVYQLSWGKLGRAITRAFDVDSAVTELVGLQRTWQIGAFAGGVPLILTIQGERVGFRHVATELIARLKNPFVLLSPTKESVDAVSLGLLRSNNAGFFDLETYLTLLPSGGFASQKTGGELFSAYLPARQESLKQTEAARIIGLLKKLQGEGRKRKASPHKVFNLTVLEGLTQGEAAKRCDCAPALISKRVKELEKEFGGYSIEFLRNSYRPELLEMSSVVKGDSLRRKKDGGRDLGSEIDDE